MAWFAITAILVAAGIAALVALDARRTGLGRSQRFVPHGLLIFSRWRAYISACTSDGSPPFTPTRSGAWRPVSRATASPACGVPRGRIRHDVEETGSWN